MTCHGTSTESPVGRLKLLASDDALLSLTWENDRPGRVRAMDAADEPGHPLLSQAVKQLEEYFAGIRTTFTIPLAPRGTPFQARVWQELLAIPYGETRTYRELARRLGDDNATRAVGAANGRNPIAILVPCHRVIGSQGGLTGFAGGLQAKDYLLRLERGEPGLFT